MSDEGRISRGWRLTRTAWGVLLSDRTALILAGLQAIASAAVAVAVFTLSGWASHPGQESRLLLAVLITYLPSTFISTFVGVGLCAAAAAAMDGDHLSLKQALGVSCRRISQILLWSLLATGVGLLLEQLAARLPLGAKVATWLAGMAWSIGTMFVLPIIALKGCDAPECVHQSAGLVKKRWGEGITGSLVIGAWSIVVAIPLGFVVGIVEAASHSRATGWLIFVPVIVLIGSVTWAGTRVFSVALYRYATDSGTTGPFTDADLRQPFRKRRWAASTSTGPSSPQANNQNGATNGSRPFWRRRSGPFLVLGSGLMLVVFLANFVSAAQHAHSSGSHLGPDHGRLYGLLFLLGLLLLLIGSLSRLWTKLRARRSTAR